MSESGFLSAGRQVTSGRRDYRPQWARQEPAWCKGVGGRPDKDVVSFTTAILPTPASPPPFLLQIHNGARALTVPSSTHRPWSGSPTPPACPSPPSPAAGRGGRP